uniref:Uncharacterized protein n=1 Tax=Romanomermis culicivorax TaxID=13658 RepID=A0A915IBW3_ROMCU
MLYDEVEKNLKTAAESHKQYCDRKTKERKYDLNNLVLLVNSRKSTKIDKDFIGPFVVVANSEFSKNVIAINSLDCPGKSQKVSLSRIKPYMPHTVLAILESEDSGPSKQRSNLTNLILTGESEATTWQASTSLVSSLVNPPVMYKKAFNNQD